MKFLKFSLLLSMIYVFILTGCNGNIANNPDYKPTSIVNSSIDDIVIMSSSQNTAYRTIQGAASDRYLLNRANKILEPVLFRTFNGKLVMMNLGYYHVIPGYMICGVNALIEYPESILDNPENWQKMSSTTYNVNMSCLIDFNSKKVYDLSSIISFVGYGPIWGTGILYDEDYLYIRNSDNNHETIYRLSKKNPSKAEPLNNPDIFPATGFLSFADDYIISINNDGLNYKIVSDLLAISKSGQDIPLDASSLTEIKRIEGRDYAIYSYENLPYAPVYISGNKEWALIQDTENMTFALVNLAYHSDDGKLYVDTSDYVIPSALNNHGGILHSAYSIEGLETKPIMDYVWVDSDIEYTEIVSKSEFASSNVFFFNDGFAIIKSAGGNALDAQFNTVVYPTDMDFSTIESNYAYYESGNSIVRVNLFNGSAETIVDDISNVFDWHVSGNTLTLTRILNATSYETRMIDLGEKPFTETLISLNAVTIIELPELTA